MTITQNATAYPVKIVGSSDFGRYQFTNAERTYNMFITTAGNKQSLVNFAGFAPAANVLRGAKGRGIFHSVRGGFILTVMGSGVFRQNSIEDSPLFLFSLGSSSGEAIIDENLSSQIAIVAGGECWVYNYLDGVFGQPTLDSSLIPNYVTYQNGKFVFGNAIKTANGSQWFAYVANTGFQLTLNATKTLQTKPDYALAAIRIPGAGNNLLVLGSTVGEIWQDVGGLDVYDRQTNININYGVASIYTIAADDLLVCWLAINEKSSAAIMYMQGGSAKRISTDGIDHLLGLIKHPEQSTAVLYRQDGHLFYHLTFFNPQDNITITYDFNTEKFYDLTNWNFNYHPLRQVTYFKGVTYFVSIDTGYIYEMSSEITTYSVEPDVIYEIPRIRVCDTLRLPGLQKFITQLFTFTIENGSDPSVNFATNAPRIDVTVSKDGGRTFGNAVPYYMHEAGHSNCQPRFNQLGGGNMLTIQMRFWGMWRFIVEDGFVEIRA